MIEKILYHVKRLIPKQVFIFFEPYYHGVLAYAGALYYGFPSRSMKVIGVTGTKGKSTVVYLTAKILETDGSKIAACGSLGFKIGDREWPNTVKMTMPGRFRLQKFLYEAKKAGCKYAVLEVTSEGIKQKRHLGITFDCAVFTNLHKEHIESHGSFDKYYQAKQELFKRTTDIHVINSDDSNYELFSKFPAKHTIFYGIRGGDIRARDIKIETAGTSFEVYGTIFNIHLTGEFNISNCLAAMAVGAMYKIDLPSMEPILESIKYISGRMEFIPAFVKTSTGKQPEPFNVVIDYAHTPDSLEEVYKTLKTGSGKLICVLGAAGGGRDKWKRPEFGRIASKYCDDIILTNEDPYDENPEKIIDDVLSGVSPNSKVQRVINRKEAIKKALTMAQKDDTVIITGKGSETSMAVSGNKKIPWSEKEVVRELLQ